MSVVAGRGEGVGHARVGDERGVVRSRRSASEAALRRGLEREPLALAAGQRDVDVRPVAVGVEDPRVGLLGRGERARSCGGSVSRNSSRQPKPNSPLEPAFSES